MTQALAIIGFLVYYTAWAIAFNWILRKNSVWFATILAIVASQLVLFGATYLYYGYWDAWWDIALVTSTAMCAAASAVVAIILSKRRAREAANAPT